MHLESVRFWIQVPVLARDKRLVLDYASSALHIAASEGTLTSESLTALLQRYGVNHSRPVTGSSPLLLASSAGHLPVVRLLTEHNADPNQLNKLGQTPLCMPAQFGHADVVKELLQTKAHINQCDGFKNPALLVYASRHGHSSIVSSLLEEKADLAFANFASFPPFHLVLTRLSHFCLRAKQIPTIFTRTNQCFSSPRREV